MSKLKILTASTPFNVPPGVTHTTTGVIYSEELSFEQLTEHRRMCAQAHKCSLHWLAGNSREILRLYGPEKLQKANELVALELDQASALQALLKLEVAPVDCLSTDHHVVLAKADLQPEAQGQWLMEAVENHLSPTELRKSIIAGKVVKLEAGAGGRASGTGVASPHAVRQGWDFYKRQIGEEGWSRLGEPEWEQLEALLAPIVADVLEVRQKLLTSRLARLEGLPISGASGELLERLKLKTANREAEDAEDEHALRTLEGLFREELNAAPVESPKKFQERLVEERVAKQNAEAREARELLAELRGADPAGWDKRASAVLQSRLRVSYQRAAGLLAEFVGESGI